jgi:hypothetical protein
MIDLSNAHNAEGKEMDKHKESEKERENNFSKTRSVTP